MLILQIMIHGREGLLLLLCLNFTAKSKWSSVGLNVFVLKLNFIAKMDFTKLPVQLFLCKGMLK